MSSPMTLNGGTIVAMAGAGCVCVGSDLRLGSASVTLQADKPKLYRIGDRLYVGMTGFATDAETVVERIRFRAKLYELREDRKLRPPVLTMMLSNLLYEKRFGPYYVESVVAGLDPTTGEPFVANTDIIGCVTHPQDFVVAGTAEENLFGICESVWEPNMDQDNLFEATAQALLSSLNRDASSGWGAVVYTITRDEIIARTLKARLD